jgi:hypothetical protein
MAVSQRSSCVSASAEMRVSGEPWVRVSSWTRPRLATVSMTWLAALPLALISRARITALW